MRNKVNTNTNYRNTFTDGVSEILNNYKPKKEKEPKHQVCIAEYGGISTLSSTPIKPIHGDYQCKFVNKLCKKKGHVCSYMDESGNIYLACPNRSCSTACSDETHKKNLPLTGHQYSFINPLMELVLPGFTKYYYNREVKLGKGAKADYLFLGTDHIDENYIGPDKLVGEMQCSEISGQVKKVYKHLADWEERIKKLPESEHNRVLREFVPCVYPISDTGFRLLLGQLLQKGSMQMNYYNSGGIFACIGEPIYNFIKEELDPLPDLRNDKWNLCFTTVCVNPDITNKDSHYDIFFDEAKTIFTDLDIFRNSLYRRSVPDDDYFTIDKMFLL